VILNVDPSDPTPVYEQIRGQVTRMVVAGTLTAGTRLPTIRQLAVDLGLAKGTVAKAYESLLRDGIVESAGRRGTVVADHEPDPASRDAGLQEAARAYAVRVRQLGAGSDEAVAVLRAALDELR
jgi:DNA-binding transcriptional regulator YhcF (GntR family)